MNMIKTTIAALALGITFAASAAEVPNEFASGEAASAAEVNANFAALVDAVTALEERVDELETPVASVAGRTYQFITNRMFWETGEGIVLLNFGGTFAEFSFDEVSTVTLTIESESEREMTFNNDTSQALEAENLNDSVPEVIELQYSQDGNEITISGIGGSFYANNTGTVLISGAIGSGGEKDFEQELRVMVETTQ